MIKQAIRFALRYPMHIRAKAWDRAFHTKETVGICAIFREEAPFLADWIEFHRSVGVTRFYLYNNFSMDGYRAVLEPYVRQGLAELTDWPVHVGQISAYRDSLKKWSLDVRWIAFIDIDEFLFAPDGSKVGDVLQKFADLPGVHVWQAFFGSSGHEKRPAAPVPLAYRHRAKLSQTTVKTVVNPRQVYKIGIHESKFWKGQSLDTAGRPVKANLSPVLDTLRINHYWSRPLEDLDQKVSRGDASTSQLRDRKWHFEFEKTLNDEIDNSIIPLAESVFKKWHI